jgi:hypothetical protein
MCSKKAFEQLVIRFSWIHQIAHLLKAHTSVAEAPSQRLTFVHALTQSSLPTALVRVVTDMEKITIAFAPQLFEYLKQPLLPRTNNDLELLIGRLKQSRRHITGRKNTQAFILREGSFGAMLLGPPEPNNWVDAFARLHANAVHQILNRLWHTEKRRQCWHTRRDVGAYLPALEQPWGLHE